MVLSESWVALSLSHRIGSKTMDNLLQVFGSSDDILQATLDELLKIHGIGKKTAESILAIDLDDVKRKIDLWQELGIHIIPLDADNYPQALSAIPDPPLTLFARGNYQPETWQNAVAIVGTRQPSQKATVAAHDLAKLYAESGWIVVSGLALGIDSEAHQGALQAQSAATIAVLGGGVLNIYPPENESLADAILERGALISENEPYASSSAPRLIIRNRIISGLCQRIIVVQSDVNGGAMHAAKAAHKQERAVFTVDWQFSGNQALLKDGAKPIKPDAPVIPSPR